MTKSIALPSSRVGPNSRESRVDAAMVRHGGRPLSISGADLNREQVDLLTRTIAKGATPDELALFVQVCNRTGLDPFTKQIHAVKRWDNNERRMVMAIQTGIDGYRLVAQRSGAFAGSDDYEYGPVDGNGHPEWARCTVYKIVAGVRCPITRTARWAEFKSEYKEKSSGRMVLTPLWAKMPFLMLGKCAEAQAQRAAFPAELSGVYTHEEMGSGGFIEAEAQRADESPYIERQIQAGTVDVPHEASPEPEPARDPEAMKDDLRAAWKDADQRPAMQTVLDRMGVTLREIATMPDDLLGELHAAVCGPVGPDPFA